MLRFYFGFFFVFFFFQAEDGIRVRDVTGVQTCALPISSARVYAATISCSRAWSAGLALTTRAVVAMTSATSSAARRTVPSRTKRRKAARTDSPGARSEEHTSELQSHHDL